MQAKKREQEKKQMTVVKKLCGIIDLRKKFSQDVRLAVKARKSTKNKACVIPKNHERKKKRSMIRRDTKPPVWIIVEKLACYKSCL